MSSVLTDVADAVAAALNAAVIANAFASGIVFAAVAETLPERNQADYGALTVLVSHKDYQKEVVARGYVKWTVDIEVTTIQHVNDKTNSTIDPLMNTVDTMSSKNVLEKSIATPSGQSAEWIATAGADFDRARLSLRNTFFNQTTYTYVTTRRR